MAEIIIESSVDKDLGKKSIGLLLFQYSLPAIIATVATSVYNIVDRIYIGQFVGPIAISGLAITLPLMNICSALGTLISTGAASIISIRLGENKRNDVQKTLDNAISLNIIVGIFVAIFGLLFLDKILYLFGASQTTLPYARAFMRIILIGNPITQIFFCLSTIMRASGYPIKAMFSVLISMFVNLLCLVILLFLRKISIESAAIATIVGQSAGLVFVFAHFCNKKHHLHFIGFKFEIIWNITKHIVSIGLSPFFIHVCTCLVVAVFNWQLKNYGGDFAVGAYGVISTVVNFATVIVLGLSQGMQPIVGYNFGAKQMDRVMSALWITICVGTFITVVAFFIMEFFPLQIAYCFTHDLILSDLIRLGMRYYVLLFPLVGFQIVVSNFFQSIGLPKTSIFLSASRQLIFLIPLVILLPRIFCLKGIWYAMPVADFLSTVITAGLLIYYHYKYPAKNENITTC
ncbi:MAG: MATE family efflux transporter [Bacteroidales bacterium]|nr:MATE family efflux transporter [Bacteroidales bacterium]